MFNITLRLRALVACFGLLFGFGLASIAGVLETLASIFTLNAAGQEWLVTVLIVASFVGALLAAPLCSRWGRRPVMFLTSLLAIAGYILVCSEPNHTLLLAARCLLGLSIGLSSMVIPMYAAETSPPAQRGAVVASFQLAITAGILLAYALTLVLTSHTSWSNILSFGLLPASIALVLLLTLPESPVWLSSQCKAAHPTSRTEHHCPADPTTTTQQVPRRALFAVLSLCGGLFILQNLSGIDGIIYYAPHIFQTLGFEAGVASLAATLGLGSANFLATLVALRCVDRAGRRPLLLWGTAVMSVGMALVMAGACWQISWLGLIGLCFFIVSFALSLGPLPYVMMSELFPSSIRESGIAAASAISWLFNALIAFYFLSAVEQWGLTVVMAFFLLVCLIAWFVGYRYLPETRQIPLDLIERDVLAGRRLRELGQKHQADDSRNRLDRQSD